MSNTKDISNDPPTPTQSGPSVDLQRLVREFEYRAKCCDQEVAKAVDPQNTLLMSDCEVKVYEQAARTYRHCIELTHSNANSDDNPNSVRVIVAGSAETPEN